jgi:hypothetical protein
VDGGSATTPIVRFQIVFALIQFIRGFKKLRYWALLRNSTKIELVFQAGLVLSTLPFVRRADPRPNLFKRCPKKFLKTLTSLLGVRGVVN